MIEKGRVVSIHQGRALIELVPGKECEHCNLCSGGVSGGKMSMELEAIEGLRAGHEVTIEIDSKEVLKGGWTVFILPLIAFIVGAAAAPDLTRVLGMRLRAEIASLLFGGLLLGLTFLGVYLRARRPSYLKRVTPRIVEYR
jgi:sigma-E factor negative regulatory protein RseC